MDREAKDNVVVFRDAMTIISNLEYDADNRAFLEKESTLQVFEVEPSTGDTTTRGSITFPLQHHCSFGEDVECKYLELHTAEGCTMSLVVSSRCMDGRGGDSEECSGSEQSELQDYPIVWPWDEHEHEWELETEAPALTGEMEALQAEIANLKSDQGQQTQDMHDEMVSLDDQLKEKTAHEKKASKKLQGLQDRLCQLETDNKCMRDVLSGESGTNCGAQEEELLVQIDELRAQLSESQNNSQVLQASNADLQETVSSLEEASQNAVKEKARADKLEKEHRRLAATVKMLQGELDGN